jgi:hypothetical protein
VGLGNIAPERALALEALRLGLRFETLKPIADKLRQTGRWAPDHLEAVMIGEAMDGRASLSCAPNAFPTAVIRKAAHGPR